VPNLAIHLTSGDERTAFKVNTQTHLGFPVLATSIKKCAPSVVTPPNNLPPLPAEDKPNFFLFFAGLSTLNKPTDAKPSHQPLLLKLLADELGVEGRPATSWFSPPDHR
jgi:hypothetical protein